MGVAPKDVTVTVADGDTEAQVATKLCAALAADTDVGGFFADVLDSIGNQQVVDLVRPLIAERLGGVR